MSHVKSSILARGDEPIDEDLTLGQERFANYFAVPPEDGTNRSMADAYLLAYPDCLSRVQGYQKAKKLMAQPKIMARVQELRKEYQAMLLEQVKRCSIATKAKRIERQDKHWKLIQDLIDRRAGAVEAIEERKHRLEFLIANEENPETRMEYQSTLNDLMVKYVRLAGEETGLLARDLKGVGSGNNATIIDIAKFDKAPLDALLDLENQVAKELGENVQGGRDINVNVGIQNNAFVQNLSDDELDDYLRRSESRKAS